MATGGTSTCPHSAESAIYSARMSARSSERSSCLHGSDLALAPVGAILVGSIRLTFLEPELPRDAGRQLTTDASFRKGKEMGWFEHGSDNCRAYDNRDCRLLWHSRGHDDLDGNAAYAALLISRSCDRDQSNRGSRVVRHRSVSDASRRLTVICSVAPSIRTRPKNCRPAAGERFWA